MEPELRQSKDEKPLKSIKVINLKKLSESFKISKRIDPVNYNTNIKYSLFQKTPESRKNNIG